MRTRWDPTGRPYYAIGVCDRCHFTFFLDELIEDGNTPGLRVCDECCDELDPYRLPARPADNIVLPFVRPDSPISLAPTETEVTVRITEDGADRITEDGETRIIE